MVLLFLLLKNMFRRWHNLVWQMFANVNENLHICHCFFILFVFNVCQTFRHAIVKFAKVGVVQKKILPFHAMVTVAQVTAKISSSFILRSASSLSEADRLPW